jgi:ABC-type uncharacterized transport system ATPase subunit
MSQLTDYLLGQTLHKLNSIESKQIEQGEQIETITEKLDEALTWAQRLVLLGLSLLGAMGLNYSPDKLGEALAQALKALK